MARSERSSAAEAYELWTCAIARQHQRSEGDMLLRLKKTNPFMAAQHADT
jgi:hypothetical protein